MIKVRFAPSPTGYLHVGGARTALFNWLFARSTGGQFVLRIEDTDLQRSEDRYLSSILKSLEWLGLDYDSDIVYQSRRTHLYRMYAQKLLDKGLAYKSTRRESEDETSKDDKGEAVYFRVEQKEITFYDKVHDKVTFDTGTIKDLVLIKSDGSAAYNFACVVDDMDMGISHIIRGDDHISNTPKQILLYQALEAQVPKFAHLPLILGPDGSRLSKRHGATSVDEFKKQGFLAEAMFNYLSLLGWSPGGNQEIVSQKKIISLFSLNKINKVNAIFDLTKLKWINSNYIKQTSLADLSGLVMPYLEEQGYDTSKIDKELFLKILNLYITRFKTLKDITVLAEFFFTDNFTWQEEAVEKNLKTADSNLIKEYCRLLGTQEDFSRDSLEKNTKEFISAKNTSLKELALPVRVALTGRSVSPEIFSVMNLLGKDKVISRINYAIENKIN